jgi:SulP family sulfate permease
LGQTRLTPRYFGEMVGALALEGTLSIFPVLITAALSVAFLASTKTLLAALNVQNLSHQRSDVNRELMAQGLANIAAAGFGGIASEGSFSQSVGNYQAGGRTRLSGIAWSVVTLLAIFVLAPFFQLIPNAVISGLLLYIALTMTDRWSLGLLARVISDKRQRKLFLTDALLIVLVTVVTLVTNLNVAVAVGVLASIVVFVVKMSKTTVRRRYDAASRHSKRQRDERALAVLTEHGGNIHVIELEGSLFFASADALALELDTLAGLGVHAIILDLKRLRDIDLSSVRVLTQTYARLRDVGCQLALSYVQPDTLVQRTLVTGGLFDSLPLGACFADTDSALERFEDHLLASRAPQMSSRVELELPDVPILAGLSPADLAVLKGKFYREHYRQGERIVCQGDPGDAMYIITRGLADVILDLPGGRSKRLSSLTAGTFFGELALLDRSERSANIDASQYLVCYRLDVHDFERLQRTHPDISITLLANISRTLTTRLRYANETIVELEL